MHGKHDRANGDGVRRNTNGQEQDEGQSANETTNSDGIDVSVGEWGNVALSTRFTATGVDPGFTSCLMGLIRYGLRPGDEVMPPTIGQAAHHAMNNLIRAFLGEERYKHCGALLTLDYDHQFDPDTLERLRSNEDGWACGGLGALYISRTDNRPLVLGLDGAYTWADPYFRVKAEWRHVGVTDVDLLCFGFTLWRREMLASLPEPWCTYIHGTATEDVSLSRACRLDGWRLAVDTEVPIGHLLRVQKWPYDKGGE
jgi:hypothetical protein